MTIEIRHIEPDDYEAVHQIYVRPRAIWGTLQLPYPSAEMWRKRLAEPPEGLYNLVACAEDEVIGHQQGKDVRTQTESTHGGGSFAWQ